MSPRTFFLIVTLLAASVAARPSLALDVGIDLGGAADIGVDVGGVDAGGVGDEGGGLIPGEGSLSLPPEAMVLDQEGALKAVREDRALPLHVILKANGTALQGEVIDAQLISYRGFLLYELKLLRAGGELADTYFYAQSGRPVVQR